MSTLYLQYVSSPYDLQFATNATGTFDPYVTGVGLDATWYVSGETPQNTLTPSFTLDGTVRTVGVSLNDPALVTLIDADVRSLTSWSTTDFTPFTSVGGVYINNNSSMLIDLSKVVFSTSQTQFRAQSTDAFGNIGGWNLESLQVLFMSSTDAEGDISGWTIPSGMTYCRLNGNVNMYGDISGWTIPSTMTDLWLGLTGVYGAPDMTNASSLDYVHFISCGLTQAQVDAIISEIYTNRAVFPVAPELAIGGSNAAPSGTYAEENPPTTGKGKIFELVNNPGAEGFNPWTISYTA